ncbi:MAG TPA: PAS domain-containing protein, partial [Anaeromyxobacter sp.]|nr:PAS domain-containing protein [Anaeromyxobacter sp.]
MSRDELDAERLQTDTRPDAAARAPGKAPAREADLDLLCAIIANVRDYAIFALDATGRVVTWNPGAEAIKGWRADEIIGQHFSAFYPPDDVLAGKP